MVSRKCVKICSNKSRSFADVVPPIFGTYARIVMMSEYMSDCPNIFLRHSANKIGFDPSTTPNEFSLESVKISSSGVSGRYDLQFHLVNFSFQNFRFLIAGSFMVTVTILDFSENSVVFHCSSNLRNIRSPEKRVTDIACAFTTRHGKPFSEIWPVFNNF
ncbi:hypothetical protein AYI69_g7089 [Smittium culicis]|uniref:Uncharacterized protein n=1 Tax=Smittium culicis TaxID=133412 RepID=A0A1R1XUG2_9FUNG|nr:hypothetical protein AYI69_g7089 [Smittium culicis]